METPGSRPFESRRAGHAVIALDLLRGLAAIAVLLAHARGASFVEFAGLPADQRTVLVGVLFGLTRLGREAVLVFFVLSGFLVGGQIVSRLGNGSFRLSDYAIDRCSRILLPLIPACLLTEAVNALVFHRPDSVASLFGSMCGLNGLLVHEIGNNGPLWTLTFEIWFYLAGGACAMLVAGGKKGVPLAALIVAALCVVVFSILDARLLLYWVSGALAVLCLNMGKRGYFLIFGGVLSVSAIGLHQLAWSSKSSIALTLLPVEVSEGLLAVGICLLLPALCDPQFDRKIRFLRSFAAAIGGFSFSLYLIHAPINAVIDLFLPKASAITVVSVGGFILRVALALVAAIGFYWMFERHTYRLRRYLKSRLTRPAPPAELPAGVAAADEPAAR
jgi:peptidoglycan/LPS O-acetylase OafA/YrhL